MTNRIDEKWLHADTWQRVVDGELAEPELHELVSACERHPELWKSCAVAFLEEQALKQQLQELAGQWPASAAEAAAQQLDILYPRSPQLNAASGPLRSEAPVKPVSGGGMTHLMQRSGMLHSQWLNHLALVASITLAFLIGWQASRRIHGDSNLRSLSGTHQPLPHGNTSLASQAYKPGTTGEGLKQGSSTKLVDTESSAAYTADAIELALERPEQFVPLDRRIPKPLADLEQRGLVRIESTEGFVPVTLRDGNTAVVPVQQIELRPVRNAY